jgi:hypothetical protein
MPNTDAAATAIPRLTAELARLERIGCGHTTRARTARRALAICRRPAPRTFSDPLVTFAAAVSKLEAAVPRLLALGKHAEAASICTALARLKTGAAPRPPAVAGQPFSDRPAAPRVPSPLLLTADPAELRAMGAEKRYALFKQMTPAQQSVFWERRQALVRDGRL